MACYNLIKALKCKEAAQPADLGSTRLNSEWKWKIQGRVLEGYTNTTGFLR